MFRYRASRLVLNPLSCLLLAVVLAACSVSPTGRQRVPLLIPADQMNAMGIQAFQTLKEKQPVERSRRVNTYVQCIANAITAQVPGQAQWEVVVFEDDEPNAFAVPGGKIGVHTGMLEVARDQHQLAAVLGHEVGHVLAQHSNERATQQLGVQVGLTAVGMAFGGDGQLSSTALQALGLGAQFGILLPYSRIHESESDEIGLNLMARAGFDPRASVALWRNMAQAGGGQPPEFMSTHPAHGTRIQDLQAKMDEALRLSAAARAQGLRPTCDRFR